MTDAAATWTPIGTIKPWDKNPRRNSSAVDEVAKSIKRFGFGAPILARTQDRVVIAGHTRLKAAQKLGLDKVPVRFLDLDPAMARALALADNKLGELAQWDDEGLADVLRELEEAQVDFDGLGFSDEELDDLLGPPPSEVEEDIEASELFSTEQQIDAAVDYFRERGFPYRAIPLHLQMHEINAMRAKPAEELMRSRLGYGVADTYHPHRFHATVKGKISPFECFSDDKKLRKAISLSYEFCGRVGADSINYLSMAAGAQACANFRPGFAAYLYRKHCPAGGTVLDTSTGYGGRLVGFIASGIDGLYIGIDPNIPTHEANQRMIDALGLDHLAELINLPVEDVPCDRLAGRCDFAFTSPPYFTKEHYSEAPTQSWKRYPTEEKWRAGFLEPMMRLQFEALKPGATAIVNIADVKIGAREYDCVSWTREAAHAVGFEYIRTDGYRLTSNFLGYEKDSDEPVLVFLKPAS